MWGRSFVRRDINVFGLWRLVDSSVECRDRSESRWRQIDAKRTPCDARAAFSEENLQIAVFLLAVPHEEAGRAEVFAVLLSQRCSVLSRSIGLRRDLARWIRDFERNPRSPYLRILVKLVHRTWRSLVVPAEIVLVRGFVRCQGIAFKVGYIGFTPKFLLVGIWSLIELDRDTLHTRLGSAHECHSGVRLVLLRWCRSCQLDLLSTDQLEWIEPDSRNGTGTGVFTVPGTGMLTVPIGLGQI
uniref:Uncharacterized protein n=1 Tax=Ananas comosus var. bracteatus TaxID=296719 RepID=A0A6V7NIC7_ANACO|nr:unnamed protein product [Ananas comosus var. bracteatus]